MSKPIKNFKQMAWIFCLLLLLQTSPSLSAETQDLMPLFKATLDYSPQLKTFRYTQKALEQDRQSLEADRWVNLDVALSTGESLSSLQANSNLQAGAQISNTFDIANKTSFNVLLKQYELLKNHYQSNLQRKQIFIQLSTDYYRLLAALKLKAVHEASLTALKSRIGLVAAGVEKGLFPAMDNQRLQIEVFNQQTLLANDQLEIRQRLQNIRQVSGLDLSSQLPDTVFLTQHTQLAEEAFVQNAPELMLIEMDRLSSQVVIQQEQAAWYPDLQLSQLFQLTPISSSPEALQQLKATLSFKLLSGGRPHRIEAELEKIKGFEQQHLSQELMLRTQFRNQAAELNTLAQNNLSLSQALSQSRSNLERLQEGYRKKFSDLTTLITANRDWLALEASYLDNLARYNEIYQTLLHQTQGDIYQ